MRTVADAPADMDRRDLWIGGAVAVVGGFGVLWSYAVSGSGMVLLAAHALVALTIGAAVACHRRAPGLALTLVWIVAGLHLVLGLSFDLALVAVLVVAYGTARYGSAAVLWASGASIPLGVGLYLFGGSLSQVALPALGDGLGVGNVNLLVPRLGFLLVTVVVLMVPLAVPWFLGLLLRSQDNARRSRELEQVARTDRDAADEARTQAQEIAELRERQNRLARDVHDVVGHSLTVILAQAEAAKLLAQDEPEQLRDTWTPSRRPLGSPCTTSARYLPPATRRCRSPHHRGGHATPSTAWSRVCGPAGPTCAPGSSARRVRCRPSSTPSAIGRSRRC